MSQAIIEGKEGEISESSEEVQADAELEEQMLASDMVEEVNE